MASFDGHTHPMIQPEDLWKKMLVMWIVRTNISLRIVSTQIVPLGTEGNLMGFRRWLVVGLCFCIFAGCKSAQSYHDYCGPMPDEGGDFLFRKNSVLGGDPAMKRMDEEPADQGEEPKETGPEPTPAPPPDQEPAPDMDMQGYRPGVGPDTDDAADEMGDEEADELADEEADPEFDEELSDSQNEVNDEVASERREASASTAQWHAPAKNGRAPVRQVRFQAE